MFGITKIAFCYCCTAMWLKCKYLGFSITSIIRFSGVTHLCCMYSIRTYYVGTIMWCKPCVFVVGLLLKREYLWSNSLIFTSLILVILLCRLVIGFNLKRNAANTRALVKDFSTQIIHNYLFDYVIQFYHDASVIN